MRFFKEIRERRLFQIVVSYAAAGWIALSVIDQLADREVVPNVVYVVALVWYLGGFGAALVTGWYHGEKGAQDIPRTEVVLLTVLGIVLLGLSWRTVQQASTTASMVDVNSVAVFYLEDDSGQNEALADGLTEALIDELRGVSGLSVASRNASAQFRGSALPADSIARVLGVGSFVEGEIDETGGDISVSIRLMNEFDEVIERFSVEHPKNDFTRLRDDLVEEVAGSLRQALGLEIELRRREADSEYAAQWPLVLRARTLLRRAQEASAAGDREGALQLLSEASATADEAHDGADDWVEPLVLGAEIALAEARAIDRSDRDAVRDAIERGIERADAAVGLEGNVPAALEMRGALRYFRYARRLDDDDAFREALFSQARTDLTTAVERDSGRAGAYYWLSILRYDEENISQAVVDARNAYTADAYLQQADAILRRLYLSTYDLGQFDQAERWCDEGQRRFPGDWRFIDCRLWLGLTPVSQPDIDGAWALRTELLDAVPERDRPFQEGLSQLIVGGVIAQAGLADSANVVLESARLGPDVDPRQELMGYEAAVRAIVGDTDTSLELLRRYVAANPGHDFEIAGGLHWWWQSLLAEPEFRAIRSGG